MSSTVDSRIVTMKFENSTFQKAAGATLGVLDKLKSSLKFDGASKGFNDVQNAASRFSLGGMTGAVTGVSKSFLALSTIAITALSNITSKAVDAGLKLAKSLTIQPILDGFHEYETQMGAIQTILSNTKDKGSNLQDVNKALNQLNHYADKTIYNFTEMTKNIGTFTAAGVDLKTSVSAIKGIANLAAMSGSTSQQASTAMYQLSQALAAGKVGLQDWNSVVNAGMGGAVFQKALVRTAQNMGTISKNAVGVQGQMKTLTINGQSFRESISSKPGQESWLNSDVLTNTLKQLSGDMTAAQLKAQGFTAEQIKAIQAMGKEGEEAATKVKTLSQLMDTMKEAVGSGWTKSFQIIFGNFTEAKTTFTDVSNTLGKLISASSNARNKLLGDWKKLGGRTVLIKGISQAFKDVMAVVNVFKKAFREIFPPATGKDLFNLTKSFETLTQRMKPSGETLKNLQKIFQGAFSIFDIFWQIIKGIAAGIGELFGAAGTGQGNFLKFLASVGDAVYNFDQFLKRTGLIRTFFLGLGRILSLPIALIQDLGGALKSLFDGKDNANLNNMSKAFGRVGERFKQIMKLGDLLGSFGDRVMAIFARIKQAVQPMLDKVAAGFKQLGGAIAKAMASGDFDSIMDVLNTGILAGILLTVKKFFSKGINIDLGGGMMGQIRESFEALTGSMKAMQANIQADTLQKIAIAIGILTASVVALSLIDSKKLTKALTAMAVGFSELMVAMAVMIKLSGSAGFVKVPLIAAAMVLLSTSVLILAGAVAIMGQLKWETIAKGLTGIAGALVVIAAGVSLMPKSMVLQAAGLVLIGTSLLAISGAIAIIGHLKWETIGKGLVGIAGALGLIAAGIALMPPTMALQAAGLVLVANALVVIAAAIAAMGAMSMEQIAKGLVTLGASLLILAAGLALMTSALPGAAALAIAAASLALLVPVLVALGNMSWSSIIKSMVGLAGAFTIIGVAGLLLTPLIPSLLGLGAAILLLGTGLALAGAGALAFATAFGIAAAAGSAGIVVLGKAIGVIVAAIPEAIKAFGKGIVQFIKVIGNSIGAFVKAFSGILKAILKAIIKNAPLIRKAFISLLDNALKIIVHSIPAIAKAGLQLILGFLQAIRSKIGKIMDVATDIIVKFLKGLARNLPRIADQGAKTLIAFLNGIARAINQHATDIRNAGLNVAYSMINGITGGLLGKGVELVKKAAAKLASFIPGPIKKVLGIASPSKVARRLAQYFGEGLTIGLDDSNKAVGKSAEGIANNALDVVKASFSKASDVAQIGIDSNPVITPILDLTKLQNDATKIGTLMDAQPLKADLSYNQAASLAEQTRRAAQAADTGVAASTAPTEVKIEQNNYSPKALPPVEIYRNTKSAIALAKEALSN